ncbi:MAG: putative aminohydrolase SsnA, partial [Coriobacteriales bacterium]|nr:putative aminohydrolase SsnA [Coriobacteriales bacterium]
IDHHASPFAVRDSLFTIAEAAELIGIRSNLCYEVSDRDGEAIADEGIAENIEFVRHCQAKKDDMIKGLVGMHAQMTVSQKTLDKLVEQAETLGAGYHIHAAEGIEDVVDALANYDRRVIERLHDNRILNERSIVVHCVHVNDAEIDLLAGSGVAVVNNPESNMSNAVGCSPVLRMLARGVLVGMGTDGYCTDMTESLRGVHAIQKHEAQLPSVAWGEPPQMLFENNKAIMNRFIDGQTGVLTPGAYADIIIVDYQAPTPITAATYASHILFGVQGRSVNTTIINGKVVMRDRELQGIDEEKLMADSRQKAAELWARI